MQELLLACCMRNGVQMLTVSSTDNVCAVKHHYSQQKSLAYGVDWVLDAAERFSGLLVGSCTFYDQTFHIWWLA
jgi:hypothetical protein